MIVVRFRMQCRPERTEQVRAALEEVIAVSKGLDGVVSFDIGHDLADPHAFIATEVYESRADLDRQEALPEVVRALELIRESVVAREAVVYDVSPAASD